MKSNKIVKKILVLTFFLPLFLTINIYTDENLTGNDRIRELEQRKRDIEKQKIKIKNKLDNIYPDLAKVRKELKIIKTNKGQNRTGILFRVHEDTDFIIDNHLFSGKPNALETLIAFNNALKERDIDLIVIPVPNHTQTYSFKLFNDMTPEHEIWPAYLEGILELLENDIEVIDTTYEYRKYAETNTDGMKVLHLNNHHWNAPGMKITAEIVMKRLNRYKWMMKDVDPQRYTEEIIERGTNPAMIYKNEIKMGEETLLWGKEWNPGENNQLTTIIYDSEKENPGIKIDPVFILGDSMAGWRAYYPDGGGFANYLSMELGFPVPFLGVPGGSFSIAYTYSKVLSTKYPQPRVIIATIRAASLGKDYWKLPYLPFPEIKKNDYTINPELSIFAEVTMTSALPDPETSAYVDALTVSEFQTKNNDKNVNLQTIHSIMEDRTIIRQGDLKVGEKYWLELVPWQKQVEINPELLSIMLIDDSENYDLEQYWIKKQEKAFISTIPKKDESPQFNRSHVKNYYQIESSGVIFLGDHTIENWDEKMIKKNLVHPSGFVNFAFSKERTETLIWRILNGELDRHHPEVILMNIGTNQLHRDTVEEIYAGIKKITELIRYKVPKTKILLYGLNPGEPEDGLLQKIITLNTKLKSIQDKKNIYFINLFNEFMANENTVNKAYFTDNFLLNKRGYGLWLESFINQLHKLGLSAKLINKNVKIAGNKNEPGNTSKESTSLYHTLEINTLLRWFEDKDFYNNEEITLTWQLHTLFFSLNIFADNDFLVEEGKISEINFQNCILTPQLYIHLIDSSYFNSSLKLKSTIEIASDIYIKSSRRDETFYSSPYAGILNNLIYRRNKKNGFFLLGTSVDIRTTDYYKSFLPNISFTADLKGEFWLQPDSETQRKFQPWIMGIGLNDTHFDFTYNWDTKLIKLEYWLNPVIFINVPIVPMSPILTIIMKNRLYYKYGIGTDMIEKPPNTLLFCQLKIFPDWAFLGNYNKFFFIDLEYVSYPDLNRRDLFLDWKFSVISTYTYNFN
jgi:lysophospholipase L1-like esterase